MNCETCRYWSGNEFAFEALCKRYPPKLVAYDNPQLYPRMQYEQVRPTTDGKDFCGEHKHRSPIKAALAADGFTGGEIEGLKHDDVR